MSVLAAGASAGVGVSEAERVRLLSARVAQLEAEAQIARRLAGFCAGRGRPVSACTASSSPRPRTSR